MSRHRTLRELLRFRYSLTSRVRKALAELDRLWATRGNGRPKVQEPVVLVTLGHPVRRQILRVLNENRRPMTVQDITSALPEPPSPPVAYHMEWLKGTKCVKQTRMGGQRVYYSNVVRNSGVGAYLDATANDAR